MRRRHSGSVYFGIWIVLSRYFIKKSSNKTSPAITISPIPPEMVALGLALYSLSQTFAAFDWMMSLDPPRYSTIYGVYYFAGSFGYKSSPFYILKST